MIDCFGWNDNRGTCAILTCECRGAEECRFYKSRAQKMKDDEASMKRLRGIDPALVAYGKAVPPVKPMRTASVNIDSELIRFEIYRQSTTQYEIDRKIGKRPGCLSGIMKRGHTLRKTADQISEALGVNIIKEA